ncbi:MAG: flagellar basal-body MS-ring/collar protein FliF [bacterium]
MLQTLLNQFLSYWNDLTQRQQIIFSSIIGVSVFVIVGLLYWSMQPQWVVLYNREMNPQEASKIASKLDDMGARYKIEGNIIKVPLSQVDRMRLQLAQQGVQPSSTVGFEIFEKGSIGITDFERMVRYKRALEGSLTRSINSNPKIKDSHVEIAMPRKEALFKEDEKPVKATVKLELEPYSDFGKENVRGIVNLVSYGVVGLKPKNVVVMDQNDRILSEELDQDSEGLTGKKAKQLQVKSQVENKLEKKLRQSLGRVLTRDRISVAVTAEMDFDRIEKKMEHYSKPEGSFEQLKASEKQESKDLQGENVQPGGPAGTESNIPGAEETESQVTDYQEQSSVVNYFANKDVTNIVKDPALTRVSSVVTVDGTYEEVTENGETTYEYNPPSEEQMQKIRELAQAAVGYSEQRGDQIKVSTLQFDRSEEIAERKRKQRQQQFQEQAAYFIAGIIALTIIIAFLIYWLRSRGRAGREGGEVEPEVPSRDLMAEVSVEEMEREETLDELQQAAEENPENFARILRSWFAAEG